MSGEEKKGGQTGETARSEKLERCAFHVFTTRLAHGDRRTAEAIAIESYREASAFLDVTARFMAGKIDMEPKLEELILCDVSVPKLKKTHPHNLVSRRFGDLKKVLEINDLLAQNPLMETYSELEWDAEQVRLARVLFPAYAEKAAKHAHRMPATAS